MTNMRNALFYYYSIIKLRYALFYYYSVIKLPDCSGGLFDVKEHVAGETGSLETAFR